MPSMQLPRGVTGFRGRGFSLLEVLVALSIMALSLAALYHAIGGSVRSFSEAERSVRVAMLVDSLLAGHVTVPPEGLDEAGRFGEEFIWSVRSDPVELDIENPAWDLHRVEVLVSWQSRGRSRTYRAATLRPVDMRIQ